MPRPIFPVGELFLTASAAAIGGFALAQSPVRAAIVHIDVSTLAPLRLPPGIRSRIVNNINGLAMHVLEAGFETKGRPCILLLHGFPELAYSWRKNHASTCGRGISRGRSRSTWLRTNCRVG
jgi:hypothetical protein